MLLALALLAVVLVVLCVSLWRGAQRGARRAAHQRDAANNPAQANAAVYRDQLAELTREHALGNLNDDELHVAREELAQRLLVDVGPAPAVSIQTTTPHPSDAALVWRKPWVDMSLVVVLLPVLALVLYSLLGQPTALDPMALKQGVDTSAQLTPEKLTNLADTLSRRLQDEPNSIEGWTMLARLQSARGHWDEAAAAFGQALSLSHDDDLAIERAQVLAQKNGGSFDGEPWAIIRRVLAADAHHLNALFLAGSASYAQEDFRAALAYWERARRVVPADSADAAELERAMAQARSQLSLPVAQASTKPRVNARAQRISGRVQLGAEIKDKVAARDTVFIYATAVTGSRMPVAMLRTTADKLPFDFVLDDSTRMRPDTRLSDFPEVTLRVRISKTGQVTAQAQDYGVSLSPVKLGSQGVALVVRDTLPAKP